MSQHREEDDAHFKVHIPGAGELEVGQHLQAHCGPAVGACFGVSWGKHGYAGGVMDISEVVKLRDHLNKLIKEELERQNGQEETS